MNQPQKPQDPPSEGAAPDANPAGTSPSGIPDGMDDHEAKGTPNSDRNNTEKSPNK